MRFAAITIFLFVTLSGFSQSQKIDFSVIDNRVTSINEISPQLLSYKLTAPYNTELEKVRSIFRWITEHIEYKIYAPTRRGKTTFINYEEEDDNLPGLKPLNERVSCIVLKKKTAICDQYSRLFKTLCDYAGICSEIVMGYARPGMSRSRKFGTNHSWNAVQIAGKWHLLDVTWASGYIYGGMEFIKRFDEYYFLTAPDQFIRDHYPDDLQWTLLEEPPSHKEFANSPFKYSGFVKSRISSIYPAKGIIETFAGDTIKIEIETNDEVANFLVTDTYPNDPGSFSSTNSFYVNGRKLRFDYVSTTSTKEWLYVILNEELVLRYKIDLKKDNPGYSVKTSESISQ
jgi:transglutaminase/protease-like cytokinesis protein 3